jgi:hypothetical protein
MISGQLQLRGLSRPVLREPSCFTTSRQLNRPLLYQGGFTCPSQEMISQSGGRTTARSHASAECKSTGDAVDVLQIAGRTHPHLVADLYAWGLDSSLQQLTMDSDADIAATECLVKQLLFYGNEKPEVSSTLAQPTFHLPFLLLFA